MDGNAFALTLLTGLATGMFLVLVSAGLTIVFGMQGILNFAHGSFYMLGAYFSVTLLPRVKSFPVVALAVFVLAGAVGAILERLLVRRLAGRPPLHHLMVTFGAALIIGELVKQIWGPSMQFAGIPPVLAGVVRVGQLFFPKYFVFVILFSLALMVAGWLLFTRSRYGLQVQAITNDRDMARALGIPATRLNTLVFAVGAGTAGLAGMLAGPVFAIHPTMDLDLIAIIFAVVIFGGLGDLRGALAGGLILGLVLAFGTALHSSTVAQIVLFLVMAVVVILRPNGLFGRPGVID